MRKPRGAARPGVLIVHETDPASYGWATVKNSNTNTMFDIVRTESRRGASAARRLDPARPRRAAVRGVGHQFEAMKAAAKRKDFRPVPLKATPRRSTAMPRPRSSPRTMSSASCPARRGPTRRSSTPPIGTISASACPTPMATGSIMARSTTAPASRHVIEQARAFAARPAARTLGRVPVRRAEEKGLLG